MGVTGFGHYSCHHNVKPGQRSMAWWNETIHQATSAFIRVNELGSLIKRSLSDTSARPSASTVQ